MKKTILLCSYIFIIGKANEWYTLSKQENEALSQICGKYGKDMTLPRFERKVLRGHFANPEDAPWSVAFEVTKIEKRQRHSLCSGTLISPRHVLTARHCFMSEPGTHYTWIVDEKPVNWAFCRNNNTDYTVPGKVLRQIKIVFKTACATKKTCSNYGLEIPKLKRRADRITLLDMCIRKEGFFPPDMAIVELDRPVYFSPSVHPVCVLQNDSLVTDGNFLQLFGYGDNPAEGPLSKGRLRYELSMRIEPCIANVMYVCTNSISKKHLACRGDSGAGSIVKINGIFNIFGVLSRGDACTVTLQGATDYLISTAYYRDKICLYTGVCKVEKETNHTVHSFYNGNNPSIQHSYLSSALLLFIMLL